METPTGTGTPKGFFKTLSIIHMALLGGLLLVTVLLYLQTEKLPPNDSGEDVMIYIFPSIGILGIFLSKFLFKQQLQQLEDKKLLSQKLPGYLTASLISYALIEGPAFLNIVWFGSTGNMLYFAVTLTLIVYLLWQRPTRSKIENDLNLTGELKRQFNQVDAPFE